MTNVKISSKGQAFLNNGHSSMELARKIAEKGGCLSTKEGIIVTVGGKSIAARSIANKAVPLK